MMKAFVFYLIPTLLGTSLAWGQQPVQQRGRTEFDDGAEVLTRGPIHEAFAGTVAFDPGPGIVAPKTPPAAIEDSRPGAIGNPKVTTPQKKLHGQPDVGPGKSPGKANDKPGRNPQGKSGKSAGKPTDVPSEPQGGVNENPKVEQPKLQSQPQSKVESKP